MTYEKRDRLTCGGFLGRATVPQAWQQDFPAGGHLKMSLPDVNSITVDRLLISLWEVSL